MQTPSGTLSCTPAGLYPPKDPLNLKNYEWEAIGVADFGRQGNPNVDPSKDGIPDICLRDKVNGLQAMWIMGGANGDQLQQGYYIGDGTSAAAAEVTWRIVATHDF